MKLKFVCSLAAMAVLLATAGLAQTSSASPAQLPSSPGSTPDPPSVAAGVAKVGTININSAILYSNEGQRDFQAMQKKYEPKQNELKAQNDEIDQLRKQLNTQGGTMNEDAKANLQRQIEQKQKALERGQQDFQEEVTNQENEIAQRILQKMAPMVQKFAQDNGFDMIIDTSNQWPQGPVLWQNQNGKFDITKQVIDQYNAQSGVAAPAARTTSPTGTRPVGSAAPRTGTNPTTGKPGGTSGGITQPPK